MADRLDRLGGDRSCPRTVVRALLVEHEIRGYDMIPSGRSSYHIDRDSYLAVYRCIKSAGNLHSAHSSMCNSVRKSCHLPSFFFERRFGRDVTCMQRKLIFPLLPCLFGPG